MGKYDTCMKEYLQNKEYFADLFNGCFFHGKTVICAEDLTEASENYTVKREVPDRLGGEVSITDQSHPEIVIVDNRRSGTQTKKQQLFRDVKMRLKSRTTLQVLAVENQSYVDYSMPVRCMDYDVAEYNRQLKEKKQRLLMLQKRWKESGEFTEPAITYAERLSGVLKTDRLLPVYTICLYSGTEDWDGPRKLSDMMAFGETDRAFHELFADYPIHLFCVNEQTDFAAFHTELKELLQAISCRKDKVKLDQLIRDDNYAHLTEATWEAIATMTGHERLLDRKAHYRMKKEEGEEYNMCEGWEELRKDYINEGISQGISQGEAIGKNKQQCYTIQMMLKKNFDLEQICVMVGCDPDLVEKVRNEQCEEENNSEK